MFNIGSSSYVAIRLDRFNQYSGPDPIYPIYLYKYKTKVIGCNKDRHPKSHHNGSSLPFCYGTLLCIIIYLIIYATAALRLMFAILLHGYN